MSTVNAGGRLDRLPITSFHYRIIWLVGLGMFFDGFDIYVGGNVLGTTLRSGFSTLQQNAMFVSMTFVGMMLGALLTGFLGDRYGRRFTYQVNLLIFGLASFAAAFAPSMTVLNGLRFIIGLGLGAEIVAGYSTLTEFVPASSRGKWQGIMAVVVVSGNPVTALISYLIIPNFGWRSLFFIGGVGALIVWYLRKRLPESPRWLESVGRTDEAEALMQKIEAEISRGQPLPAPAPMLPSAPSGGFASLFAPPLLARLFVGCVCLVTVNTLLFGFVVWLPTFFIKAGLSLPTSFGLVLLMGIGAPIGCAIGAFTSDGWGRKPTIITASILAIALGFLYISVKDPILLVVVGFLLNLPIYVLVALGFGIYTPELFPTDVRMRGAGICNTVGRGATIITPFIVVMLFQAHGVAGVMSLMIGLLLLQAVVVFFFGIEPRHRRLEEMKPEEVLAGQSVEA